METEGYIVTSPSEGQLLTAAFPHPSLSINGHPAEVSESSETVEEERKESSTLPHFSALSLDGHLNIRITTTTGPSTITTTGYGDRPVPDVTGGVLHLRDSGFKGWVELRTPSLLFLSISGSTNLNLHRVRTHRLRVRLFGTGNLHGSLRCGDVVLAASGASNCELGGRVDRLNIRVSGAANLRLSALQVSQCEGYASECGRAEVSYVRSLVAATAGLGCITYYGRPDSLCLSGNVTPIL